MITVTWHRELATYLVHPAIVLETLMEVCAVLTPGLQTMDGQDDNREISVVTELCLRHL